MSSSGKISQSLYQAIELGYRYSCSGVWHVNPAHALCCKLWPHPCSFLIYHFHASMTADEPANLMNFTESNLYWIILGHDHLVSHFWALHFYHTKSCFSKDVCISAAERIALFQNSIVFCCDFPTGAFHKVLIDVFSHHCYVWHHPACCVVWTRREKHFQPGPAIEYLPALDPTKSQQSFMSSSAWVTVAFPGSKYIALELEDTYQTVFPSFCVEEIYP